MVGLAPMPRAQVGVGGVGGLRHPTRESIILYVGDAEARVFQWRDLELIRVVSLSLKGSSIQSLIPLTGALVATTSGSDGIASSVQLWNLDSDPSLSHITPSSDFE